MTRHLLLAVSPKRLNVDNNKRREKRKWEKKSSTYVAVHMPRKKEKRERRRRRSFDFRRLRRRRRRYEIVTRETFFASAERHERCDNSLKLGWPRGLRRRIQVLILRKECVGSNPTLSKTYFSPTIAYAGERLRHTMLSLLSFYFIF